MSLTMTLISSMFLLFIVPILHAQSQGCGMPVCGGYRPYPLPQQSYPLPQQPQPQPLPPLPQPYRAAYPQQPLLPQPQPQPQQSYYYAGGYAQPPPPNVLAQVDEDLTTMPPLVDNKAAIYERYEQKMEESENVTPVPIVTPPVNQTTYIREKYIPDPYLPRPMPYRPHPMLPAGCPVLPPQYLRPTPYMPRGYVTPISYIAPPPTPAPIPTLPPFTFPTLPPLQPLFPPTPAPNVYGTYYRPINDCCGRCGAPCRLKMHGTKTQEGKALSPTGDKTEYLKKDPKCSSDQLRDIMEKSTTQTAALSKRLIQKKAEEEMGGLFSVFCSREDFSYVARSETYCQTSMNDVICYAFQHN